MLEQSLLSKYVCIIVLYDSAPKQQHPRQKAMTGFIVFRLLSRCKSFIMYENYYIQGLLHFDSLDGNGALLANVLSDIPVLVKFNSHLWMQT